MYCEINSAYLIGLSTIAIRVEVSATPGLPQETIIGLPDTVVKESRSRIKSALKLSNFNLPPMAYTINLAPIDISKKSPCLELAITVGLLVITNQISIKKKYCFLGSLSLNGAIEPIRSILPIIYFYKNDVIFVIPKKNCSEIKFLEGIRYKAIDTLADLSILDSIPESTVNYKPNIQPRIKNTLNFDSIIGHSIAKQACAFSIAGGIPLLFIGPPGIGKTLLINHMKSLVLPLSIDKAIENFCIQSILTSDPEFTQLPRFQAPHHTSTYSGMIGGQNPPKPGDISLANHGILFLDELGEYKRDILDTLREPLETAKITISRAGHNITFPANFLLVSAMNPCHCGYFFSLDQPCQCRPNQIHRYWHRLSNPLLDRFGICLILNKPHNNQFTISHQTLLEMIHRSKEIASQRNPNGCKNNDIPFDLLIDLCQFETGSLAMIDKFCETSSFRARNRLIKLSLTIADCNNASLIKPCHVALAIQLSQHSQLP